MSAIIRSMVLRKRAAQAEAAAARERFDQWLAAAKGEDGSAPEHEWDGTKLRFRNPDGTWGPWVQLRGAKGPKGADGKTVVLGGGGSGFNPGVLGDAADEPAPEQIMVMQEGAWVRATWAQFVAWIGGTVPTTTGVLAGADRVMVGTDRVIVGN